MVQHSVTRYLIFFVAVIMLSLFSCCNGNKKNQPLADSVVRLKNIAYANPGFKCIHVFVALCDNRYQGIVPVPPKLGNGQDPDNNLYWGSAYGVSAFFRKSTDWELIETQKLNDTLLERLVFKNKSAKYYLVADAYNGKYIKRTTVDFLSSCAGRLKDTLHIQQLVIGIDGNAALLAYIGHDGLMDFHLQPKFSNRDGQVRDCMVLACDSKSYFGTFLQDANAHALILTSGLMCPEAYTLHDAVQGYMKSEPAENIRLRAVAAYNKYQKCGLQFADQLLVSGN